MWSQLTRPSLLARLRDGHDELAWREFDQRYRDLIVRYARQSGLQPADAEDVRQVVMMNLARAMPGFQYDPGRGRFRGYLGRVVRNAVRRHQRGQGARFLELGHDLAEASGMADPIWDREWMLHHYRRAMGTVRRGFEARSVSVFDRILAGDPVQEVATDFDLTVQAVHKVKQRIRRRLQDLVARQVAEEDGL
ncbi:MAG: hypothetical protein CMJ83_10285 [Planctomycetes bacterium]|nr:hypothetical protein [Planctomycetota bacterium]